MASGVRRTRQKIASLASRARVSRYPACIQRFLLSRTPLPATYHRISKAECEALVGRTLPSRTSMATPPCTCCRQWFHLQRQQLKSSQCPSLSPTAHTVHGAVQNNTGPGVINVSIEACETFATTPPPGGNVPPRPLHSPGCLAPSERSGPRRGRSNTGIFSDSSPSPCDELVRR